jgi:two-component system OmpR family response regulator
MSNAADPTVLLVEDDDDNRELMAEVLESAGYRVVPVESGAEALRAMRDGSIDAVVTDIGLPGVGGLEVARAAKALRPPVPVLVVTGYSERDDVADAQGKEVDAVLVKPIDPEALVAGIRRILDGR